MHTYSEIAKKLIDDKLYLTALELHTELQETGKEVKELKDFFSNPGNFEQQVQECAYRLSRSGSQVTLDSLDLTRYSEDGERGMDEKIAVLEFELRKAKETINALRNNLTVATECEGNTPVQLLHDANIMPHEQRALNFLINEYLLSYGYKLTSITFADENEEQDFDDWDDVGLNISKPAGLVGLYREALKRTGNDSESMECQTDFIMYTEQDFHSFSKEREELHSKVLSLENQITSSKVEMGNLQKEIEMKNKMHSDHFSAVEVNNTLSSKSSTTSSATPECFEIIESNLPHMALEDLEDTSCSSFNDNEWIKLEENKTTTKLSIIDLFHQKLKDSFSSSDRKISANWRLELLALYPVNIPKAAESNIFESIAHNNLRYEAFVQIVSQSLLRVIPNVILNKREEVVPLLVSAICANSSSATRDKLIQQLFNLKKKPTSNERAIILAGIIKVASHCSQDVVESEILPQCCEQLSHKHKERRLLVGETCIALVPYISNSIRHSLLYSILQQMYEDRDEMVRILVVKAISLVVALCNDPDKYMQCLEFSLKFLKDDCDNVFHVTHYILYPILAEWALDNSKIPTLVKQLTNRLVEKTASNVENVAKIFKILEHILPFILVYVANNNEITDLIEKDVVVDLRSEILKNCSKLTNPQHFYNGMFDISVVLHEFEKYMDGDIIKSWLELNWISDLVLDLINGLDEHFLKNSDLVLQVNNFFSKFCVTFGKSFAKNTIRPIVRAKIRNLERELSTVNQATLNFSVVPIYLLSVLTYCEDTDEILTTLKQFIFAIPLCGASIACLEISVAGLCGVNMLETVLNCLWEGVVHQQPVVRATAGHLFGTIVPLCDGNLLYTKVVPALVTLANDTDLFVRVEIVPAIGCLITDCDIRNIHDKAYMLLQTFLTDLNYEKNHPLLKQLVSILGIVADSCSEMFRHEVVIPQISYIATYAAALENVQRKVDIVLTLEDAFTKIVYSKLNNKNTSSALLYSLRSLETIVSENQSLISHKDAFNLMIKECENRIDVNPIHVHPQRNNLTENMSMEEVRNRMSKMFNKSSLPSRQSLSNVQSLFKKK